MNGMSEHKRNMIVTTCLEANAYYNSRMEYRASTDLLEMNKNTVIAEAYLMRVETITKGE